MIARQLAAPEVMLCATPEYLRVNGTPQTLDDISQHRCLNYGFDFMRHNWMIHERVRRVFLSREIKTSVKADTSQ
jgi:DNA-binding transcriptional LysR family regulator